MLMVAMCVQKSMDARAILEERRKARAMRQSEADPPQPIKPAKPEPMVFF